MKLTPRDSRIKGHFDGYNGLIASRARMVSEARTGVVDALARGDIPHLGLFVEAMAKRRLITIVRADVESGHSWSDALDRTRDVAMKRLMNFVEDADPWERANTHSHKIAAAWFLKETDGW